MPSLRELQRRFARALTGEPGDAAALLLDDGLPVADRIGIYANNARVTFRTALELTFPVTRRLGGDAWFAGAAGAYRAAHPSRSGDLQHAGERFPAFLAARLAGGAHAVLADVAALEWACECAATAPDGAPLDLGALAAALAGVPEHRHGELRFELHPTCRLVASAYPVVDVWEAHRAADQPAAVDLDAGAQHALVLRRDDVEVHRIDAATHAFVRRLAAGATLADAADEATRSATIADAAFPLDARLPWLATLGVLGPARF